MCVCVCVYVCLPVLERVRVRVHVHVHVHVYVYAYAYIYTYTYTYTYMYMYMYMYMYRYACVCICIYDRCCFAMLLYGFGTSFLHLLRMSLPLIPSRVAWRCIHLVGFIFRSNDSYYLQVYGLQILTFSTYTLRFRERWFLSVLYNVTIQLKAFRRALLYLIMIGHIYINSLAQPLNSVSVTWASSSPLLNPATWIRLSPYLPVVMPVISLPPSRYITQ